MYRRIATILILATLLIAPTAAVVAQEATPQSGGGIETVVAGLTNPRGFTWDDDGTLYLALAGTGGPNQVVVEATPLPFMVGLTSSIVTVSSGCTSPFATDFSSALWTDASWIWGVMDIAFLDGQLYALAGAGAPEGGNGIYRVSTDGSRELVADLGAWTTENPTALVPPDYDPTGSWFDLEAGTDRLWVTEAVGGRVMSVTPTGEITLVADLSEGHLVPTGLALDGEGGAYVGFETTIPYPDGSSKVVHIAADGTVTDHWTGLTAVTDIALGPDGVLYAAEMATNNLDEPPYLNPNSGRIVRMAGPDTLEDVITGLPYPVMIGFDDAGALYVSLPAFTSDLAEGTGALISVDPKAGPFSYAGFEPTSDCA